MMPRRRSSRQSVGLEILLLGYIGINVAIYALPRAIDFAFGRGKGTYLSIGIVVAIICLSIFINILTAYECTTNPREIAHEDDGTPVLADCKYEIDTSMTFTLLVMTPLIATSLISLSKLYRKSTEPTESPRSF